MTKNDIKLENVPEGVERHDTPEGKELCIRPDDISRSKGWGFALCALCILIVNISISQSFDGVPNQYVNYLFGILYIAALLMCLLALFSFYSANRRRKVNYIVQLKRSNTNFFFGRKISGKKAEVAGYI